MNDRLFVFSSGIGLDASVVERVDAHPYRKARLGPWYYTYAAVATFSRRYLFNPPRVRLHADGRSLEAVTVIVQNSDPFTYFSRRPIRVCEGAGLETGTLSMAALKRATLLELPTLIPRVFSRQARIVQRHRQVEGFPGLSEARVESVGEKSFPLQVDGDYIGEFDEVVYRTLPGALVAVA